MENQYQNSRSGRIWAGLFILGVGLVLLVDRLGLGLPSWVFSWPMIVIAVGIFLGLKHRFRSGAWLPLLVVGLVFLFDKMSPGWSLDRYFWPIIIMTIGLVMIFKPKGTSPWRSRHSCYQRNRNEEKISGLTSTPPVEADRFTSAETEKNTLPFTSAETVKNTAPFTGDYLDSAAVFGGVRKAFFTKDFKGGEAVSVFGGHEIDLSRSDIKGMVTLELTQIFGGTKLIIPNNWNVKTEVVAFLGGIEDKRHSDSNLVDPDKILLLKGTSVLGGIDIKSY